MVTEDGWNNVGAVVYRSALGGREAPRETCHPVERAGANT